MATIALYSGKIDQMPGLIKDVKSSVKDLKSELTSFKAKCSKINRNICDLDDVISTISTSTQTQEQKVTSLENFSKNVKQFATDAARIDDNVADVVNKNKNDFYNKYHYLKPKCEKSGWEKLRDGLKAVGEWCKDNWKSICNILLAILAVVAIVVLSVITLGTAAGAAAVLLTAAVGAVAGLASQLISDIISWAVTGEWTGTWQSYAGAILGGIAGGVLMLWCGPAGACAVDAAISKLFSESLEGITGGKKRSMSEIWLDTAISAGTAALFSKVFDKLGEKLSKTLSKEIPALRRLSGRGSYSASFNMVVTKLKNRTIENFTSKTIRNGIVSGLAGDIIKNIANGFGFSNFIENGVKDIFIEKPSTPLKPIMSPIKPLPQINFLPIRTYSY